MKVPERSNLFLILVIASAALLVLAGCGGGGDSATGGGGNPNARDNTTLQSLADQAAADSGLSGFVIIDATNAATAGGVAGSSTSGNVGSDPVGAPLTSPLNVKINSMAHGALSDAISAMVEGGALEAIKIPGINRFNFLTQQDSVNETVSCLDGSPATPGAPNTVTLTGTISITVPDDPATANPFTVTIQLINLTLDFNECFDGFITMWGSMRWNSNDSLTFNFLADNITFTGGNFSINEFFDGGVAFTDGVDNYKLTLAYSEVGTINFDDFFAITTVSLTGSFSVNTVSCTTTVTSEAQLNNPVWICTAS